MTVCWSGRTTRNPCDPRRCEKQASVRIESCSTSRVYDDFRGGIAFGDVYDALAALSSESAVFSDQSLSSSPLFGPFLPPSIAAVTARENGNEKSRCRGKLGRFRRAFDMRSKEREIVVVKDHQRVFLGVNWHAVDVLAVVLI